MKDTTLKSLSEVVDKLNGYVVITNEVLAIIFNYNKFLIQVLQLWMFIPTNSKGEVLEEPIDESINYDMADSFGNELYHAYKVKCDEYQQALDRIIFKGFRVVSNKNGSIRIENNEIYLEFYGKVVNWFEGQIKSIQDLEGKVQLTNKQHELLNLRYEN